jgi:hypothetical protein
MHDDADQVPTVEQIRAEREALEAEMDARRVQIERAETLEWCKQRAEARQIPEAVTKSAPVMQARRAAPAPASMSRGWQDYIEGRIRQESRALERITARGIGQSIGAGIIAIERSNAALFERVAKLEAELAELKDEVKTLEAAPRGLRAVSS